MGKGAELIKHDTIEDNILEVTFFFDKPVDGKSRSIDIFTENINYFTLESLSYLAAEGNFEVISIEEGFTEGFHLTAILRKKHIPVLFFYKKRR